MSDHGEILTNLDQKFGREVDYEVIKLILQNVNWNAFEAEKQLSKLSRSCDSPSYSVAVAKEVKETTTHKNVQNTSEEIDTITCNRKYMIIMRGLPGSGKSFQARKLLSYYSKPMNPGIILSTDDYFYDNQGYYHFNPPLLSEAHNWNQNRARHSLFRHLSPIIIDNTNLQKWEMEPYVSLALNYGYYIMLVEPDTPWRYKPYLLSKKCIHNVPREKIEEMKGRFDKSFTIDQMIYCIRSKNLPVVHTTHRTDDDDDGESEDDPDIVVESSNSDNDSEEKSIHEPETNGELVCNSSGDSGYSKSIMLGSTASEINANSNIENNSTVENTNLISQEMTGDQFKDIKQVNQFTQDNSSDKINVQWECTNSSNDAVNDWEDKDTVKNGHQAQKLNETIKRKSRITSKWTYGDYSNESEKNVDTENGGWCPTNDQAISHSSWEAVDDHKKSDDSKLVNASHTGAIPRKKCLQKLNDIKDLPAKSIIIQDYSSHEVQTCSADFLELNQSAVVSSKILYGSTENFISKAPIELLANEPLTKSKLMLHKSSMTEEYYDAVQDQETVNHNLQTLQSLFPSLLPSDLQHTLSQCNEDIDWAVNILIDSNYTLDPHSGDQIDSYSCIKNENTGNLNLTNVNGQAQCNPSATIPILNPENSLLSELEMSAFEEKSEYSSSDEEAFNNAQYLTMDIDDVFASQLTNTFGPVSSLNLASNFCEQDKRIVLPLDICQQIHKFWAKTLDGNFQDETEILNQFMKEDEALARKLQEQENAKHDSAYLSTSPANTVDIERPTNFKEIQDIELAMVRSIAPNGSQINKYSHPLCLQKLTKEFSHVDSEVVKKTYDTTLRVYDNARAVLCAKYGTEKQPPINIVADQAKCIKYSLPPHLMPVSATEENQIEEFEANQDYLTVENPQDFRNEAEMHYRARKEDLDKAQEAKRLGVNSAVSAFYAKRANLHSLKLAEANERAAKLILNMINSDKDDNTLDLHLLLVPEAIQATQDFLVERQQYMHKNKIRVLKIKLITGRGRHSAGNKPRIKPAIHFFLQKEKYNFCKLNAGSLEVTLRT